MRPALLSLLLALGLLTLPGCAYYIYGGEAPPPPPRGGHAGERGYGPPPHAPANGYYRHRPRPQVELAFDDGLGVYVVLGHSEHYFFEGRYYRWWDGAWQVSVRIDDGWNRCGERELPGRLGKRHAKHARRHHEDRGDDGDHRGHGRNRDDDHDEDDDARGWPARHGGGGDD